MREASAPRKKIVFLHIPKTAGQSVHRELRRAFGPDRVSPVVVTAQGRPFGTCFPEPDRYDVFAGHLDWHDLDARIPPPRRVFTILREPRERLASHYFYELSKAGRSSEAEPVRRLRDHIKTLSPDDFFANPDLEGRVRIDAIYDNYQTRYLARSKHRWNPGKGARPLPAALVAAAVANATSLDLVCTIDQLDRVEQLVWAEFGRRIALTTTFVNRGQIDAGKSRYAELAARIKHKRTLDRIAEFCALDEQLMRELGLA